MILDIWRSLWYLIAQRGADRNWKQPWVTSHSPAVLAWRKLPVNRQELRCVNEAFAVGGMCRNCKSELGLTLFFFRTCFGTGVAGFCESLKQHSVRLNKVCWKRDIVEFMEYGKLKREQLKKTGFCSVNKEPLVWAHRGLLSQLSRQQRPKISSLAQQ